MMNDSTFRTYENQDVIAKANEVEGLKAASKYEFYPLAPDFEPGPLDVICARGKFAYNHSGNKRYKMIVDMHVQKYLDAASKLERSFIVSSIVDSIREASPEGGFVKKEGGRWFQVGDRNAREKVGQSLRDILHLKYRSSTKAKTRRKNLVKANGGFDDGAVPPKDCRSSDLSSLTIKKGTGNSIIDQKDIAIFGSKGKYIQTKTEKDAEFHNCSKNVNVKPQLVGSSDCLKPLEIESLDLEPAPLEELMARFW